MAALRSGLCIPLPVHEHMRICLSVHMQIVFPHVYRYVGGSSRIEPGHTGHTFVHCCLGFYIPYSE